MSYFQRACEFYLRLTRPGKPELMARCRRKYERGVNLVAVPQRTLATGVMGPHHCDVDPGRIFLTYERLMTDAFRDGPPAEYAELFAQLHARIQTYDPNTTLLWLCVLTETDDSEMHVFET